MRLACLRHGISIVVAALFAIFLGATPLYGGSGLSLSLPVPPKTSVNGLVLSVDCNWAEGRGYRPMRVDVTCTPPASADRTLNIEFVVGGFPMARKYMTVLADVEIPAGSTTASKVVSLPDYSWIQTFSMDVWEDGVQLEDLSVENRFVSNAALGFGNSGAPSILFVTSGQADVSQLGFLVANLNSPYVNSNPYIVRGANRAAVRTVSDVASFASRPAAELVENWINYSSLDVICIALGDALNLAIRRPRVWRALREWTSAGGNLCVYKVGKDFRELSMLEEILKCPAAPEHAPDPLRGWTKPARESDPTYQPQAAANGQADADAEAPNEKTVAATDSVEPPTFVSKPIMMGQVVAIAGDPFPGKASEWQWIFATLDPLRTHWRDRNGVNLDIANPGFDNLLIAEIGLPPVKTYRILISLFVIGIGPLNYWWLRRRGRLHLLLFTVPAAALLVSAGLIGYVLLADGLYSRVRARSYTELDQHAHQAVVWSRLSYYAGLAPRRGLVFPDDTVVLPLEKDPSWGSFGGRSLTLAWISSQHLIRGWLPARTPTQYLAVRAFASPHELKVTTNDEQQCTVANHLGAKIKYLLLSDSAGKLHFGRQIDEAGESQLQALDTETRNGEARREMQLLWQQAAPQLPSDMYAQSTGGLFGFRSPTVAMRNAMRGNAGTADVSTSLLEVQLKRAYEAIQSGKLAPRAYLAIVERPADVVGGVENFVETQSLHVISGAW